MATSNDFLRKYQLEKQLEHNRFVAQREQERQKRLERIAKEEQKLQKQEQPKPPAPTAEAVERATPPIAKPKEQEVQALSVAQTRPASRMRPR